MDIAANNVQTGRVQFDLVFLGFLGVQTLNWALLILTLLYFNLWRRSVSRNSRSDTKINPLLLGYTLNSGANLVI